MPYFMIYNSGRRQDGLQWDNEPVGVFKAETAENACKAAAHKTGRLGTFFAVEGYPWGVQMLEVDDVQELGADDPIAAAQNKIRELERRVLENPTGARDEEIYR